MSVSDTKLRNAKAQSKNYRIAIGDNTYLDVMTTGRKVWRMRYNKPDSKKPAIYTIGEYPDIKQVEARQAAQRALKNVKQRPEHSRAMQEWLRAEAHFTQCLRDLRTLVQTTPELHNHPDLLTLRADLLLIEQDLSMACQQYNQSAGFYNQFKHDFPSNVAALALGHTQDALLLPLEATIAFEPRIA